jgi:hypothetical protein
MVDPIKIHKYSDKILEIIDNQDNFTRGDLQGAVEAVVMNIIIDIEAEKK